MKPMDYIITAAHHSQDGTPQGYLKREQARLLRERGINVQIDWTPTGTPLQARVERGQWIADCECGGATFVDPEWPFTFCFSCRANNGHIRPVQFPSDWKEIEKMLLARPVNDIAGLVDTDRAALAQPLVGVKGKGLLHRNWLPDESLKDLHAQQDDALKIWKKHQKGAK